VKLGSPVKGPSVHLTWQELACKDGTPYPKEFIKDGRVFKLAMMFEQIRRMCGNFPLHINSAYRTPKWNRKVGGARNSQHLQGLALDIEPPENLTVAEFYDLIHSNYLELGVTGLGYYKTFVHCDCRTTPNNRLVVWNGNGVKDSTTDA
jgi:hypothetical protein